MVWSLLLNGLDNRNSRQKRDFADLRGSNEWKREIVGRIDRTGSAPGRLSDTSGSFRDAGRATR